MGYVDRHLLPGETVTYRTLLHWKSYVVPILIALLVLLPLIVVALGSGTKLLALPPALAALVMMGIARTRRRSAEFAVTNRRVIIKVGVLSTRSIELLLPKIEAIAVSQSLAGRLFGYGDIVVTGSGGTRESFSGIQSPLDFRHAVQAAAAGEPLGAEEGAHRSGA
ncbi:MAG: PH domain-containing protein [Candidatus Eisenbacteria bacterium]|nr:PH domain-containing protein [Candidatus Eisenbacteria bacterium]